MCMCICVYILADIKDKCAFILRRIKTVLVFHGSFFGPSGDMRWRIMNFTSRLMRLSVRNYATASAYGAHLNWTAQISRMWILLFVGTLTTFHARYVNQMSSIRSHARRQTKAQMNLKYYRSQAYEKCICYRIPITIFNI